MVDHRSAPPELALVGGAVRRLGRDLGVVVERQREVAEHQLDLVTVRFHDDA